MNSPLPNPRLAAAAPRDLVLCCDATSNTLTGGVEDTNALLLYGDLRKHLDASRTVFFYDPGLGTPDAAPPTDLADLVKRKANRIAGLASGRGVYDNELRLPFPPRLYDEPNELELADDRGRRTFKQLWFPGVPCDVGGSYTSAVPAWADAAWLWMFNEVAPEWGLAALTHLPNAALSQEGLRRVAHPVSARTRFAHAPDRP